MTEILALRGGVLLLEEYFESSRLHKSPWRIYLALSLSTSRNRVLHLEIVHWLSKQTVSHSEREQAFRSRRSCWRPQSGIGLHSLVAGVLSANSTARQLSNDLSLEGLGPSCYPFCAGRHDHVPRDWRSRDACLRVPRRKPHHCWRHALSVARKFCSSPVSSISVTVTSARPCSPKETCSLLAPNVPLRFREGDCPKRHTRHVLSLLYFTTPLN